ncbi:MFS transporter [Rhodococcus sp. ACPA4]|uniref:DHA2 family lincomycin resistance protein-like MFS transporter n=1 Tax=Nocardia globerula TaxID=1818 RepID=A0A652YME7_NOCGL|nr:MULTISPECIES: MDR family MFS transporter [Rhodococcus]NMD62229.1 multidrug efflux MFS transporter [Nocardia globerula]PBC41020.1 MFS transporter [Rhodococcus sp. ACPA4]PVX65678.1 DHA2 family lincomycin resistance protein-like MFS transporter [Rhodococcus globerulus]RZL25604.1 MAG: DHA2 family efflux MFS transporter permease subunit [Rhodococcus sp. (in: high G+C Gram-positive bacteria)]
MHIQETEAQPESVDLDRGSKLLITVLVVAAFVMILNETIMSVALPRLMVDLDITASTAQWLTTGFMLTMAVVIPTTGYLFQRFTLRQVFAAAMTLFSVGTLLAASAPGFELLLAGRVIQAGGTAIMLPLLMTTVLRVVPAHKRGAMMGVISIVIAVAPAIGPTLSGVILRSLDWRWMFWLVLPIALVAFAIGSALVKNLTTTGAAPFDGLSVVLSALAFGGIVYGLGSLGHSAEGSGVPVWVPLVVGVVALVVFVLRQLSRQEDGRALLDMRPFLTPTFSIGLAMLAISMMALFGALILLPLYLQNVLGLDTLKTGLLLLPGGLLMGILAPFVGRVFDRVGPRPLVIPGVVVVSAALWLMTLLDTETGLPMVVGIHSMLMVGLALVMTPLMTSSLGSVPSELYSHGSAIFNTGQQLAGAAGTALFVTIMSNTAASQLADGATDIAAQQSGIHTAFMWGGVISLIAVAGSFFIRKPAVTS